ncbi:MAG: hypothetical protein EPO12_08270 [Aquabacterium sp.]|nr:MAG: hypothetical protein EPO12_08270 [Aquabacterium sp.]
MITKRTTQAASAAAFLLGCAAALAPAQSQAEPPEWKTLGEGSDCRARTLALLVKETPYDVSSQATWTGRCAGGWAQGWGTLELRRRIGSIEMLTRWRGYRVDGRPVGYGTTETTTSPGSPAAQTTTHWTYTSGEHFVAVQGGMGLALDEGYAEAQAVPLPRAAPFEPRPNGSDPKPLGFILVDDSSVTLMQAPCMVHSARIPECKPGSAEGKATIYYLTEKPSGVPTTDFSRLKHTLCPDPRTLDGCGDAIEQVLAPARQAARALITETKPAVDAQLRKAQAAARPGSVGTRTVSLEVPGAPRPPQPAPAAVPKPAAAPTALPAPTVAAKPPAPRATPARSAPPSPEEISRRCRPDPAAYRRAVAQSCYGNPNRVANERCTAMLNATSQWTDEQALQSSSYYYQPGQSSDAQVKRELEYLRYRLEHEPHTRAQTEMEIAANECVLTARAGTSAPAALAPTTPPASYNVPAMSGRAAPSFAGASSGNLCAGEPFRNPTYETALSQLPQEASVLIRGALVGIDLQLAAYARCPDPSSVRDAVNALLNQRAQALQTCRQIVSTDNCLVSPF